MAICWWDRCPFVGRIVKIPVNSSEGYGVFCSVECAIAYLEDRPGSDTERRQLRLFRHMYGISDPLKRMMKAPHFSRLFGEQAMSIGEFRSTQSTYHSYYPNLKLIEPYTQNCYCSVEQQDNRFQAIKGRAQQSREHTQSVNELRHTADTHKKHIQSKLRKSIFNL